MSGTRKLHIGMLILAVLSFLFTECGSMCWRNPGGFCDQWSQNLYFAYGVIGASGGLLAFHKVSRTSGWKILLLSVLIASLAAGTLLEFRWSVLAKNRFQMMEIQPTYD